MAEEEGVSGCRDHPLVRGQNPSETAANESPLTYRGAGGGPEGAGEGDPGVGDWVAEEEGVSWLSRPPARSGPEPLGNSSRCTPHSPTGVLAGGPEGAGGAIREVGVWVAEEEGVSRRSRSPAAFGARTPRKQQQSSPHSPTGVLAGDPRARGRAIWG